ncbi:MAG: zinc ribbon domain-containing protein [Jatrophihabitans sp.]
MNADPAAQLALLSLQGIDSQLSQLSHRRKTLPSLAVLADCHQRGTELHSRTVELSTSLKDIATEQSRMEADIDMVRQRETRDQQRLASGGIPAKELTGLEHELETLKRRQSALEDEALEIMEQRETVETDLTAAQAAEAVVADQRAAAEAERDAAFAEIDAVVRSKQAEREPLAATISADLIAMYDKIRDTRDGVGAAALKQRRCEGCRIELAGSELNAVRAAAPDDVVRCDNCRRILVRTPESGL